MITSNPLPLVHRIGSMGLGLSVLELALENKATAAIVRHHILTDSAHALLRVAAVLSRHP